jgi:5-hydroxyisourate hydrolase-like protein (transthyretin family)
VSRAGLALLAALAFALAATLALPQTAHATSRHLTGHLAATAITGVVVNGTHGGAPVADLQVTLQATGGNGTHDLSNATTDGQGRFSFGSLPNGDTSVFAVYTRFQQGLYSTGAIAVANGTQDVVLTIYDATSSDANLRITSVTALVHDPRPINGLVGVGEYYTFRNGGNTAFVGSTAAANGMPMGLLRFALPPGAQNVKLAAGFDGVQASSVATGFGAAATVPPGDSQFAFAFDLPYTATQAVLPLKAEYPTDHALLLVPPAIHVETSDLQARGAITSNGSQYDTFTRDGVAAGASIRARLSSLPPAGEPPGLDISQLAALAGVLALLLALLVGLYLRRGDLAVVLRLVSPLGERAGSPADSLSAADREAEQVRLLRRLHTLQQAEASGRLRPVQYRQQVSQTRAALRSLLAALPSSALQHLEACATHLSTQPQSGTPEAVDPARDAAPAAGNAQRDDASDDASSDEHGTMLEPSHIPSGGAR